MSYSPTLFTPSKIGYAGYGAPYGGWFGDGLKAIGGFIKGVAPEAAKVAGSYWENQQTNESMERMNESNLQAQENINAKNQEEETKRQAFQMQFGNTTIGAGTIALGVGGVLVLGGLTYFVLRKRRK
tara:strand:- start:734 stop:1114 length:381 start_codon:yes stop_codon:yes gene_type:complete